MADHLLRDAAHVDEVLPPGFPWDVLLERLLLEAFHFFVDRAFDVGNLNVLIIHSITEQCELIVNVIALVFQSARGFNRAVANLLPYRL